MVGTWEGGRIGGGSEGERYERGLFGLRLKLMKTDIALEDKLRVLIFEFLENGDGKGKGQGVWRTQRAKVRVRPAVLGGREAEVRVGVGRGSYGRGCLMEMEM